ncbi:polyphosphate kinase 2 [Thermodesulfobacteriota bacterium]
MRTKKEDKQKEPGKRNGDLKTPGKGMVKKSESKTSSAGLEKQNKKEKKSAKRVNGPTAQIRDVVKKAESKIKTADPDKQIRKNTKLLKKKEKEEIARGALEKYYNSEEMKPYQAELIKMQRHLENTGKKMVILFDGRDASGKGGTIRRIVRYMNEKRYRVVALGKPSEHQKTELHIKRYIEHFPRAGEIVLFDRSWYNRALVEPVMGFCTKAQYKRFMKKVIIYERNFLEDAGKTILIKLYFSVTKAEQNRRFKRRKNDPLRQWKLSEVDLQAQELWNEFTEKKFMLLKKTHMKKSPWWIIRSDNKHLARRATMKVILNSVRYKGRSRKLDFIPDPKIVIPGNKELKEMKKQRKKYGRFLA